MAKKDDAVRYDAETLLKSKRFADYRDVLTVTMEKGKSYSIREAEKLISDFLKRKV